MITTQIQTGETQTTFNLPNIEISIIGDKTEAIQRIFLDAICEINRKVNWSGYDFTIMNKARYPHEDDIIVASSENTVLGYACLCKSSGLLSFIAVDPAYRKNGVGRSLMDAVLQRNIDLKNDNFSWSYRSNQDALVRFYNKFITDHALHANQQPSGKYPNGDPRTAVSVDLGTLIRHTA